MATTVPPAEMAAATTLMRPGWAPGVGRTPLSLHTLPGESLRRLRLRLGLTTRKVAEHSRRVALERGSREFAISHARLVQIENERSSPSIQKLFSLGEIYGVEAGELLDLFLNPGKPRQLHSSPGIRDTRVVSISGESPWPDDFQLANRRYGLIGLDDRTMDPLVRPGALVQIDESAKFVGTAAWRNEFERPIYFLETRSGYICSWCDAAPGQIISIPHSLSPCHARALAYPREVEVIGRVTAVAGRLC
jgi:transcriptional regulator with XRE-family HTH domain